MRCIGIRVASGRSFIGFQAASIAAAIICIRSELLEIGGVIEEFAASFGIAFALVADAGLAACEAAAAPILLSRRWPVGI